MTILHILTYLVLLICLIALIARAVRIARTPIHLRWELYPVPNEKGRAKYGGSRLEEVDWWTKPVEKDRLGELKIMIPEIFLLKGVWEHNKTLWSGSFPFHFGLYMLIGGMGGLILAAIMQLNGMNVAPDSGGFTEILYYLIYWVILAGSLVGIYGSIRMFFLRIVDPGLSLYSTPSHYFNIILIGGIYLTAFLWIITDSIFVKNIAGFYEGLITASAFPKLPAVAYWHIYITLLFLVYLPFTHMTHFFAKYFTYHDVRWDDEPNIKPGSKMQKEIEKQLNQVVTWAAPHIGADGKKTWADIATSDIPEEKK